jgi:hypothetical protein
MALPKLNAPRYEMTIPSTKAKVAFRPYLVKEEKILMLAMESGDEKQMVRAIKDVITECTESGVDVETMTMFDMEYIFTQLRSKSVGEKTTIGLACQKCNGKNDVDIDLSQVSVDVGNKKDNMIKLDDSLSLEMRYPSINNFLEAEVGSQNDVDKVFSLVGACIKSVYMDSEVIDATTSSKQELKEFIESMSSAQFSKLKDYIESMPTAKLDVSFGCSHCSEHNEIEVKGLANFFG